MKNPLSNLLTKITCNGVIICLDLNNWQVILLTTVTVKNCFFYFDNEGGPSPLSTTVNRTASILLESHFVDVLDLLQPTSNLIVLLH